VEPTYTSRNFGRALRHVRESRGLTQAEFARSLRIGQNYLSKLEKGQRLPGYMTMRRMSHTLPIDFVHALLQA